MGLKLAASKKKIVGGPGGAQANEGGGVDVLPKEQVSWFVTSRLREGSSRSRWT